MRVAIIGGGLAGCSLARALKFSGLAEPVIYEAGPELAPGASGHSLGLYNPRFSAERTAQSDYYVAGFSLATRTFSSFADVDWNPCGALHLITDEKKAKRFPQTLKNWRWEPEHMQLLKADQASEIAGVELEHEALYLPDSGAISPKKLCEYYARDVEVHLEQPTFSPEDLDADVVVLSCGYGAKKFFDWLPLAQVRGQVTDVKASAMSRKLQCNVCYGGYISPANDDGHHMLGATFQRWLNHSEPMVEDNQNNLEKLAEVLPKVAEDLKVIGHRAAVRTTTKDHFPIVGSMPEHDKIFVNVGHGSHGIISTLISAFLLTDMIVGRPHALARDTVKALSPARFL